MVQYSAAASPQFFLPGAGGSAEFWQPAAGLLPGRQRLFSWPGLGSEPHDPAVRSFDDLAGLVLGAMTGPTDLIAQSMGGFVALKVALAAPDRVRRLVLVATSGGIPVADYGATDWRADYRRHFPAAAEWVFAPPEDLTDRLGRIEAPCLLLWGSADAISPVAAGRRLEALLPRARLHIVDGGDHDLARTHAAAVSRHIALHLAQA